jgi:hypothetical protein
MSHEEKKLSQEIDLLERDAIWHELIQSFRQLLPDDIDEKIFIDLVKNAAKMVLNIREKTQDADNFITISQLESLVSTTIDNAKLIINDVLQDELKKIDQNKLIQKKKLNT